MSLMAQGGTPLPSATAEGTPSSSINPKAVFNNILLTQKKKAWAGWAEQEFQKCKNARIPYERQWHINMAFEKGRHYVSPVELPGQGFRLVSPKAPPWRVRLVINKVRTAVRTECAKLTSNRPIPVVVPATTEDEDFNAAQVAEQILKTEFASAEFDETLRSFVWWGVITGNSYLKSYWSPSTIDPMSQPAPTPHPQLPGMMIQPEPVRGKIIVERVSPFHIYVPDLLCESIEKQPYVIHVTTKHPLWVERTYGFKPTADSKSTNDVYEAAVLNPTTGADNMDSVLVKEVWMKPFAHPDFPEGGVLTVINHQVVAFQQTWPWPFQEYPFYKYQGIPTGGYYTDSVVTDLVPLNKEYNRTRSQMIEIKNLMGKPKLLAPRGSINPRQVSSEPGQAVLYNPGMEKPTVLPGVEVPSSMHAEVQSLAAEFDDISGQHEITRGNTPNSQITSGTAIAFLQEQDDTKLAYQVAGIEHCVQKLGTHYLKYAAKYWNEERLIRVVGKNSDFEARSWRGSDLRGNTDVRVQSGSALPFSKAAKQALVETWMTNGWMPPEVGAEIIGIGGFEKAFEDIMADKRQAQRENMRMAELDPMRLMQLLQPPTGPDGQPMETMGPDGKMQTMDPVTGMPWQPQPPLPINSYDNHEAHIHYHNMFRKTQQFELLPDPVKQAFELHVQAHQYALGMPQMGAAGILPVGPGEGAAPLQEESEGEQPTQPPQ